MRFSAWCFGAFLLAALTGPAEAQRLGPGSYESTAVSGYSGRTERIGGDENGLYGIQWYEDSDEPCQVRIDFGGLYDRSTIQGGNNSIVYSHCSFGSGLPPIWVPGVSDGAGDVNFNDNPRYYIRGLQVCTNNKDNHRLKGVRVWAAKVSKNDQQVLDLGESDTDTLPNCSVWHTAVFCPAGKIAFGLVVHVGDKGVTGLALRCKQVLW